MKRNLKLYTWILVLAAIQMALLLSLIIVNIVVIDQFTCLFIGLLFFSSLCSPYSTLILISMFYELMSPELWNVYIGVLITQLLFTFISNIVILVLNSKTNNPQNKNYRTAIIVSISISFVLTMSTCFAFHFALSGFMKQKKLNQEENTQSYSDFKINKQQEKEVYYQKDGKIVKANKWISKKWYILASLLLVAGFILVLISSFISYTKEYAYIFTANAHDFNFFCGWDKFGIIEIYNNSSNQLVYTYNLNSPLLNTPYAFNSYNQFVDSMSKLAKNNLYNTYYKSLIDFINNTDPFNGYTIITNIFDNKVIEAQNDFITGIICTTIGVSSLIVAIFLFVFISVKLKQIKKNQVANNQGCNQPTNYYNDTYNNNNIQTNQYKYILNSFINRTLKIG